MAMKIDSLHLIHHCSFVYSSIYTNIFITDWKSNTKNSLFASYRVSVIFKTFTLFNSFGNYTSYIFLSGYYKDNSN